MMQASRATTTLALAAILLTVAFGPVAAAPVGVGSDVTIDIWTDGESRTGGIVWVNGERTIPIDVVVARTGTTPINIVSFTPQDPSGDAAVDQYDVTNLQTAQTEWTTLAEDKTGANGPDTATFKSPNPSPVCQLTQTSCPDMSGSSATFSFDLVVPAEFSDLSARKLMAVASAGESFSGTEDAFILLGYDATKPVVGAPSITDWSGGKATLSFTVNDATSGLAAITASNGVLSANCMGDLAGASSRTCTVTNVDPAGGASNAITVGATDVAGNTDSAQLATLDGVGPTASLTFTDGVSSDLALFHSETGSGPGVTFSFADADSGIAATTFTLNDVTVPCAASPCTIALDGLPTGTNTVAASATDYAGNEVSPPGLTVKIDRQAPTTTLDDGAAAPNANGWYSVAPTLTLQPSDGTGSGVAQTLFCTGVACVPATSGVNVGTLPEGTTVVRFFSRDNAHPANTESTNQATLLVDTTAPVAGTPSRTSGLLVKSLGSITFPFTDEGSGIDEAATAASVVVLRDEVPLALGTDYTVDASVDDQVTVTVPAAASGYHEITVVGKDLAGNQVAQPDWDATVDTSLDLVRFTNIGITGTGPFLYTVGADSLIVQGAKSASSTVTVTSLTDGNCDNGANANSGTVGTANAGLTWSLSLTGLALDDSPSLGDCRYDLAIRATDPFGATEDAVLQVTRSDIRLVAVQVTPSDVFVPTGTTIVLNVLAKDVTAPGAVFATAPVAANTRIKIVRDGVEISGVTLLTNGAGTAQYSVTSPASFAQDSFQAVPTLMLRPGVGFRPVQDASTLELSSEEVVWTSLVAGTATISSSGITDRGSPLTLELPLTWQHDNSAATNLDSVSNTIGWSLAGTGLGSSDPLVPDTPASGVLAGVSNAGAGVYAMAYTHREGGVPLVEQVTFTSTGSVPSYVHALALGDAPSSFTVPTTASVTGNWIGARAGAATLTNLGPAGTGVLDGTDGFVNEDDIVRVTVPIAYTENVVGPATGATASLFLTGDLAAPIAPTGNGDAFASVTDGSPCDQDPAAGVVAIDVALSAADCVFAIAGVPNTFAVTTLATTLAPTAGVELTQSIVDADDDDVEDDRGDFANTVAPLTFTGIDVTYVAASVTGAADATSAARWWLNADPDAAGTSADTITLQVNATWTHNATAAPGALIGAYFDGSDTPVLSTVGAVPLVGTLTDAAGTSTFSFDPDTYGLDYQVTDLEFRVVRAPEAGHALGAAPDYAAPAGGEAIVFFDEAGTFGQQVLWTKIHLELSNDLDDATANLGEAISVTVSAYWYHDENTDGDSFAASSAPAVWDPAPAAAMDFTLIDTVASGVGLLTQNDMSSDIGGFQAFVSPFRGCDPLVGVALLDCMADLDPAQAGWHTFYADAADTPHAIANDFTVDGPTGAAVDSEDLLWTAAVLDLTTTRILQDAGESIDGAVQAYFVHAHDAAGAPMTLAERALPFPVQDVLVDVEGGGATDITGLTVPLGAPVAVSLERATAGTITAVAKTDGATSPGSHIVDPAMGESYPIFTVFDSATITRNFATLAIQPGVSEAADDIDYNGDGDKIDGLYVKDAVSLRGDLVPTHVKLSLDLGSGPVNVDDAFAGAGFEQTDTPLAGTDMPLRVLTSTAVPLGAQDILQALGDESINPATDLDRDPLSPDFAYSAGCACWTATIPAHTLLEEGIQYDITTALQVASGVSLVTTYLGTTGAPVALPGGTSLDDSVAGAFGTTTTAILVTLSSSVNQDEANVADGHGEVPTTSAARDVWVDFDGRNVYTVDAHWAHSSDGDGSSYILDGQVDDGDNVVGATLTTNHGITPSAGAPGVYLANLDSGDTPVTRDYVFRVESVDDPSSGDPAQAFTHAGNAALNEASITQAVHHARFDLAYASPADIVANVDDNIELGFQVTWAQLDAMDGTTVWAFPSSGDNAFTSESGVGNALLVSETTLVTPLFDAGARPVLLATGSEGFLAPHGITAYQVPTTDALAPQLIWTRVAATGMADGSATSASPALDSCNAGLTYDPPGAATADCDVFAAGATVSQGAHFQFDHDGSAASGALVLIGGQAKTADASGDQAATFRSFSDGWLLVEGRSLQATLGGQTITATLPAQNYVGFDAGVAGIP